MFFLEGVIFSLKGLLRDVEKITSSFDGENNILGGENNEEYQKSHWLKSKKSLLPRRQELVNIIEDHPYVSLENLSRRFPTIPKRTISYDVHWLVKNGWVVKHGETRGVRYSVQKFLP
jgi:predicted HTH transcriptional regulator